MGAAAKLYDETYIRQVFGWNLRKRLLDKNMQQCELAQIVGTSPLVVTRWVNGGSTPQMRMLAAICNALDCSPDYLMRDRYASN